MLPEGLSSSECIETSLASEASDRDGEPGSIRGGDGLRSRAIANSQRAVIEGRGVCARGVNSMRRVMSGRCRSMTVVTERGYG